MNWLDRYFERLFAKPAPFDCEWCSRDGDHGRHDMCTGSAVRPHREGLQPAVITECACALDQHKGAVRPLTPPADAWAVPTDPAGPGSLAGTRDSGIDPFRHVPLPLIDTPEKRRHARDRRRRVTAVKSALPAIAVVIALAVASQCDGRGREPRTPGTPGRTAEAEPAVWAIDLDRLPQRDTRSFTALVSRLGCGEVGDVLAPQVIENPSSVIVIFSVAAGASGTTAACTMNTAVPYTVRLRTPLGERTLFDGTCDLPPASTTPVCSTAQRWPVKR